MGPLILISNHPSRLDLLGFRPYLLAHKTCKKLGANIIIIIIIIIIDIDRPKMYWTLLMN